MNEGAEQSSVLKWGVERRLEFIEFRLFWENGVNRANIIEAFDVSVPQASKDLTLYQVRAPHNAIYDKSAKRYVAGPDFSPVFLTPDSDSYLARLRSLDEGLLSPEEAWLGAPPVSDIALSPRRKVDPHVLRCVLAAIRDRRSLDVLYQSMGTQRVDPMWRQMTPHALGFDGFRWHARAYCHLDERFKDFLLPRILEVGRFGEAGADGSTDHLWNDRFDVEIGPHPKLTPSQQRIVAIDFGMENNRLVLNVRYAMLFYVLKRLGLLDDARARSPRTQHIVALNYEATQNALRVAELQL